MVAIRSFHPQNSYSLLFFCPLLEGLAFEVSFQWSRLPTYLHFPVLADKQVGRLEVPVQDGRLAHMQVEHPFSSIQCHVDAPHPVQLLLQSLHA